MPAYFQGSPSAKIYLSIQSSAASRHKKGGPAEEQRAEHDEVTGNLIRQAGRSHFRDDKPRKECKAALRLII
jgi:hypothetical protein